MEFSVNLKKNVYFVDLYYCLIKIFSLDLFATTVICTDELAIKLQKNMKQIFCNISCFAKLLQTGLTPSKQFIYTKNEIIQAIRNSCVVLFTKFLTQM